MTTPYVPPRRSWRARLREVFTERLGLKAIALLLSVLLWLVVQARRPRQGYIGARSAPVTDSVGSQGGTQVGSRDTATKLSTSPPPHPVTPDPSP